jgi:chemotaxis protein MotC
VREARFASSAAVLVAVWLASSSTGFASVDDGPIDIRPPAAVKKHVAKAPVPLPRPRPAFVPDPESATLPDGVSPEIVGSTPPPDALPAAAAAVAPAADTVASKAVPAAGPAPAAPGGQPSQPSAAAGKIPLKTITPVAPVQLDPADAGESIDDPAAPFAARPMTPAAPKMDRLPLPSSVAGPRPVGQPYQLLRELQMLQDQIAQGSTKALLDQRALRVRMDNEFAAADPAVWQDKRNAAAAITYVLSGGASSILARLQGLNPPPAVDKRLIDGALAYVGGKEDDAHRQLGEIDAFELPPSMGAQVALAQSALAVRGDPEKALKLLDIARLLAPGTLVEEAALRREIFVADQMKDADRVQKLARQYLERFRHSVYAGNFRNRFAAAVSHMDLTKNADQARRLEEMLATIEPAARCQLYLTFALAAVVKGNVAAGALAADHAASLASPGSPEAMRSRLYHAAAGAADPKALDHAVADLGGVSPAELSPSDRALYDVVAATIEGVQAGTLKSATADSVRKQGGELDPEDAGLKPLFSRAGDSLKKADVLLTAAK